MNNWDQLHNPSSPDIGYNVMRLNKDASGMTVLRKMFPLAKADDMNFVLFSTSGTHGTYRTIEEEEQEPGYGITFLIIHPRLVTSRYGTVYPVTPEDFQFLRKLRESSRKAVADIG